MNEPRWHQLTQDVMTGMREWRRQHPIATLRAVETELDTRRNRMRARMLEDLALPSVAATWQAVPAAQQPTCRQCGIALQERGTHPRTLQTHGGQDLTLERPYAVSLRRYRRPQPRPCAPRRRRPHEHRYRQPSRAH